MIDGRVIDGGGIDGLGIDGPGIDGPGIDGSRINPARVVFFIPGHLKKFKLDLFNRVGASIVRAGGRVVQGDFEALARLRDSEVPVVGCTPELRPLIDRWTAQGRDWIYWDRGYARRVFATWLPRGDNGGYYRWGVNGFQMRAIRDVAPDRWAALKTPIAPWRKGGKHIVVAVPSETYARFHRLSNWTERTLDALSRVTDRPIVARHKESHRPLQSDLEGAHALVTHGSIAAVESVILGTPVFVDPSSAAALVGLTDLACIERPAYPDRDFWCHGLAYAQFNEAELVDGTLWRLLA